MLAKALGIPSRVATIHGLPEPSRSHDFRPVAERAKRVLDRLLINRAFSTVVVVSRDMRDRLNRGNRHIRGELIQIHNGIRIPEVRTPSPLPARRVIGSVGRLVPIKDYRLFLATAAAIARVDSSVHFEILGDGPERAAMIDCAAQLGLGSRFAVRPWVEDPQPFYRTLDLYLNTSEYEGCPLSILEAMASECAVVAPAVGGIPEIVQSGGTGQGWLSPTRDPETLARGCLDLLADPAQRAAMGRHGRARVVREFSAERMAQAYKATYLQ
jgi:glycosyltransferase involved in cell wall biosynthesis